MDFIEVSAKTVSDAITEACTRSTFEDCSAIDPVAIITGERMYNFNTYVYSQLNLFRNNFANNGRHHYISNGTSTTSGNVFLRCISDAVNSVNEGHRQWTQGMLYDNHKETNLKRDFVLGLYNRVAMGTGHGWSAVHSVLWNCDVTSNYGKIGLQKPPTGQNYAIGCQAKTITGRPISNSNFPIGFVEGQNKPNLYPQSLYEAQLNARKMASAVRLVEIDEENLVYLKSINSLELRKNSLLHGNLQLFDVQGKLIVSSTMSQMVFRLPNNLKSGIYIVSVSNSNGIIKKRILIQ